MENMNPPQPARNFKKNKVVLIIGIILIIVAIVAIVGTIFYVSVQKNTVGNNNNGINVTNNKGTASNNSIPSTWSSDVPLYSGATILHTLSNTVASSVIFNTNNSVKQISDYFTNKLPSSGWKIVATKNSNAIEATKDTRTLIVSLSAPTKSGKTTFEETVVTRK